MSGLLNLKIGTADNSDFKQVFDVASALATSNTCLKSLLSAVPIFRLSKPDISILPFHGVRWEDSPNTPNH